MQLFPTTLIQFFIILEKIANSGELHMKNTLKILSLYSAHMLIIFFSLFYSTANAEPKVDLNIIIGDESRIRFSSNAYPWTAYGLVSVEKEPRWSCSGTLVGPRHVLTNAHCVDKTHPISFYPSYNNGDYLDREPYKTNVIQIYTGTTPPDISSGSAYFPADFSLYDDWAILILDEPVGNKFGWIEVTPWSDSYLQSATVHNFGYPAAGDINENGRYPMLQEKCFIQTAIPEYLQHDCDTNSGSSGSSLVTQINNKYVLIGLHNTAAGENYCKPLTPYVCANGAVKTDKFLPTLKQALLAYP